MEFYLTSPTDPVVFMARDLATTFYARIIKGQNPLKCGGILDEGLFSRFIDQFNCISISSGLPHGYYGQTVCLSRVEEGLKLDQMDWRDLPQHLIGEGLSLKPDEMSGRYCYQRKEDSRGGTLAVKEFFFFEFQSGYHPETFSKLGASLSALRHRFQ